MPSCFIVQPFDSGGEFDQRYDSVIKPVLESCGIDAYRVDRDPAAHVLIRDIERGIQDADVAIADVSTDNPNIWFEVGFARASGTPLVLICKKGRDQFPFDIRHLHVIAYETVSPQSFEALRSELAKRIPAAVKRGNPVQKIENSQRQTETAGLAAFEVTLLTIIAEEVPAGGLNHWSASGAMERAGFTKLATTIAFRRLMSREYIEVGRWDEEYADQEPTAYYVPTDAGMDWIEDNLDQVKLTRPPKTATVATPYGGPGDDIPF